MGQSSSRFPPSSSSNNTQNNANTSNDASNTPSNQQTTISTVPNPNASTSSLSSLRRRRSSTNTATTLPPSRRRRLLFWNRSNSRHSDTSINTINEAENASSNPIQEAIEGSSGSGNITSNTLSGSRFIDELDDIASDLFSAVSRDNPPRARHYSSLPSLRSNSHESPHRHSPSHSHHPSSSSNHHSHRSTASSNSNSNDMGLSFEHQTEMLARLLEVAATSTILTLMGASVPTGRRFDNVSRTSIPIPNAAENNSRTLGNDTTFEEFVTGLRNGLLANEISRTPNGPAPGENMTFFRAFRFDTPDSNSSDSTSADQPVNTSISFSTSGSTSMEASTRVNNGGNSTLNGNHREERMVPVMIVGVRSVQQGSEIIDPFATNADNEINLSMSEQNGGNQAETLNSDQGPANSRTDSNPSSSSASISSSNDNLVDSPPSQQRSWVIFVMGNTFIWDHPLLSAPSLMSENPTYEDLLNLQELIGQVKPPVTTKEELFKHDDQLFEIKLDSKEKGESFQFKTKYKSFSDITLADRCQICLTEYEDNEVIRKLGSCNHFYHKSCIDTWLLNGKNNCPLCRSKGIVSENDGSSDVNDNTETV